MASSGSRHGRSLGVALAIAGLVAFLIWRFAFSSTDAPRPIAVATASESSATAPAQPSLAPPPTGAATPAAAGTDPEGVTAYTSSEVARAGSPFPPGSQPLTEGTDPAIGVSEDNPVTEGGEGNHIVFGARYDVVHPPDAIIIDAQLLDAHGKRVAIPNGRVYFRGERDSAAVGTGPQAPLLDDGKLADRAAGDRAYTATYRPTGAIPDTAFRTFVELAFDAPAPDTGERRYTTWVQYTPKPAAHLTKQFTDRIVDGSLVIDAGLAVDSPGRFKVIASLYGPDGTTAIAFAQTALELEAGSARAIPLTFFGKILHDRAIDGPYRLRYVMVFQEFQDRGTYWPGVTVDDAYTTKPYLASAFSDAEYVPPQRVEPEVTAQSPSQQGKPGPVNPR